MSLVKYEDIRNLIRLYFNQEQVLFNHLFSSFNQLIEEIIPFTLIKENNYFYENVDKTDIFLHGFRCKNIRIKPVVFDNNPNEIMFPDQARKNHLNYFANVYADVEQIVEKTNILTGENTIKVVTKNNEEDPIAIASIPIMVKSKYCSTTIKKDSHNECKYDPGGYFLVNGKEKVVMSIEKMVDNKPLVFTKKDSSFPRGYFFTCQINSKANDWSDNLQILNIKEKKDSTFVISTSQLSDIKIIVLMRALGLETDQDIISNFCYSLDDINMINLIKPSIDNSVDDEGNIIRTKDQAVDFLITKLRRNKRFSQSDEELAAKQKKIFLEKIFRKDLLPHLGEDIKLKIRYISFMFNKMFKVMLKREEQDDRDALQNKRIETPGVLIGQLFRQNWKKLLNEIGKNFKKKNQSDENPVSVINQIKPNSIEQGIKTALSTGIWGMNKTKKGVAQALQRLSWFGANSYLRRVMAPSLDASTSNITKIRLVNNLQAQFLCPTETPEGQNIGIIKSLAMSSTITMQNDSQLEIVKEIIKKFGKSESPTDINPLEIQLYGKVFMNGSWIAVTKEPFELYTMLKKNRQAGILDKFTCIYLDFMKKEIGIFSDGGRLIRPILQVENNKVNMTKEVLDEINKQIDTTREDPVVKKGNSWNILMDKFPKLLEYEDIESSNYLMIAQTPYDLESNEENMNRDLKHKDINDVNRYGDYRYVNYTHCDIHPWLMLGYVVCSIPFSNHNFGLKNIIFFSQAKQSIGVYLTSYKDRMDISQILYHPQVPLVTTEGMRINNSMDLPFGENVVIAIMSYMGYNQEDSIIFNKASVDRGIFLCDSLKKEHAEIVKNPSTSQDDVFTKPDSSKVTGMQQGNYDKLNEKGFVPEETIIQNQDIIIGKASPIQPTGTNNKVYKDNSVQFKSNVEGVIDRVHTGVYNNDGYEMYNVRLRMERVPIIGDKFCLTDDHEVLTSDGWKQINRVTTDDKVCCLNPNDNTIIYNKPSETYKFDHEGEMYSLKSQQVDLVTTMNHKMYVKKRDKKSFELIEAKDINGKRVSYKKNGINNQRELESFKIPNSEKDLNMNDFLVFLGIWFAEGWADKHNKRITFSVNKKIIQNELERVCSNLDIHIIKSNDKWHMHQIDIYNYLKNYSNGAINKSLPRWVFNLNRDQSRILLESMLKGDGYKTKSNTCKYFTSSKQLKDDVQQLALHCEWSANIYERDMTGPYSINSKGKEIIPTTQAYEVSIIKNKNSPTVNHGHTKTQNGQKEEIIHFKGKVYCLQVPSHIFYVRLNGKPVWTGNSNRHGQKGTLGILLPERDMPFTESGMVPDLIMNPHGIPSRMTHAQLLECLASKYGAITGQYVDGTPFNNYDVSKLPDMLKSVGFKPYGTETMYCGITGKKMQSEIFIGPTYYMRLKHMVLDKVHSRSIGPKQAITRQPLEGRSRDGGLKIGEMEKDSMIAHGAGQFLKERLNEVSDITKVHICDVCGRFAAKVFDKDYYYCEGCDNSTRISAVSMPYACKLLFQEITSVNIQPRIRTRQSVYEANV
jgi:DNA-directed RNA polymerase II subunit RPB2